MSDWTEVFRYSRHVPQGWRSGSKFFRIAQVPGFRTIIFPTGSPRARILYMSFGLNYYAAGLRCLFQSADGSVTYFRFQIPHESTHLTGLVLPGWEVPPNKGLSIIGQNNGYIAGGVHIRYFSPGSSPIL